MGKKIYWIYIAFIALTGCNNRTQPEILTSDPKYNVTEKMTRDARLQQGRICDNFDLISKKSRKLYDLTQKGPVLLIAIKDGCPCSSRMQPIMNSLYSRHKNNAQFIGFINGGMEIAKEYVIDTQANFPIIPDEKLEVIKKCSFKRSAYMALINQKNSIEKIWPGYSKDILLEIDNKLSQLTGQKQTERFDTQYAPKKTTAGCVLELDDEENA